MLWRLWRYLFADLTIFVGVSAAALVILMSLTVLMLPLTEGYLSMRDAGRLFGWLTVTLLPYALPFAACIGTILAILPKARLNELTACFVSGVSPERLLAPVAVAALSLGALTFYCLEYVLPFAAARVVESAAPSVLGLIHNRAGQGRSIEIGDRVIYAEAAYRPDPLASPSADPPDSTRRLNLRGLVIARQKGLAIHLECTSQNAVVAIREMGQRRVLAVTMQDVELYDATDRTTSRFEWLEGPLFEMPPRSSFEQFLTARRFGKWAVDCRRHPEVAARRNDLIHKLSCHRALTHIEKHIELDQEDDSALRLLSPADQVIAINSAGYERHDSHITLTGENGKPVVVEVVRPRRSSLAFELSRVRLTPFVDQRWRELRVAMAMYGDDPDNPIDQQGRYQALKLDHVAIDDLYQTEVAQLLRMATTASDEPTRAAANDLSESLSMVHDVRLMQIAMRVAFAAVVAITMLASGILAIRLHRRSTVLVCAIAFFATLLAAISISAVEGLADLWQLPIGLSMAAVQVGPVVGAGAAIEVYRRMRRT